MCDHEGEGRLWQCVMEPSPKQTWKVIGGSTWMSWITRGSLWNAWVEHPETPQLKRATPKGVKIPTRWTGMADCKRNFSGSARGHVPYPLLHELLTTSGSLI